jgi:hypothetical protein
MFSSGLKKLKELGEIARTRIIYKTSEGEINRFYKDQSKDSIITYIWRQSTSSILYKIIYSGNTAQLAVMDKII